MNILIVFEVILLDGLFNVDLLKCIVLKISEEKLNCICKERLK